MTEERVRLVVKEGDIDKPPFIVGKPNALSLRFRRPIRDVALSLGLGPISAIREVRQVYDEDDPMLVELGLARLIARKLNNAFDITIEAA